VAEAARRSRDRRLLSLAHHIPKRDAWQLPAAVVDSLAIEPGQRIADIGAGTGYFNLYFANALGNGGRVFAEEIEPELVVYVQERVSRDATPQVISILGKRDDPCLPEPRLAWLTDVVSAECNGQRSL